MSRRATGSVYWLKDKAGVFRWHVRNTKADGSRPYEPIEDKDATWARDPQAKEQARGVAAALALLVRPEKASRGIGLTFGDWLKKLHADKAKRGKSSTGDMKGRADHWILPSIGHSPIVDVTRADVEAIVAKLDTAVAEWNQHGGKRGKGRLSHKSAANVWSDLSHAFSEALNAKDPALRVIKVNPCAGVRGPDSGNDREGPILYSDEILSLLRCPDVPQYRRTVYAVAIYTAMRSSELAALMPSDVDLDHGTIMVSKQADRARKGTKPTKTDSTRTIDIEPNVRHIVEALVKAPQGRKGRLLRMPPIEDCAELLRKDLHTANVKRDALHSADTTRTRMTFHCLRDTGLTHMAVRGDSPPVIQWKAGHADYKMTQTYVQRGRVEARRIGVPLPQLPGAPSSAVGGGSATPLAVASIQSAESATETQLLAIFKAISVTPTGIEPVLPT